MSLSPLIWGERENRYIGSSRPDYFDRRTKFSMARWAMTLLKPRDARIGNAPTPPEGKKLYL